MEINIGMSECHKNVDNYYSSNITVWIPCCAGREAFDGVEPLPESKILIYLTEIIVLKLVQIKPYILMVDSKQILDFILRIMP